MKFASVLLWQFSHWPIWWDFELYNCNFSVAVHKTYGMKLPVVLSRGFCVLQVSQRWNSIISRNQRLWRNLGSRNGFLVPAEPSADQLADASFSKCLYLENELLVKRLIGGFPTETTSLRGHIFSAMFFYDGKLATGICEIKMFSIRLSSHNHIRWIKTYWYKCSTTRSQIMVESFECFYDICLHAAVEFW